MRLGLPGTYFPIFRQAWPDFFRECSKRGKRFVMEWGGGRVIVVSFVAVISVVTHALREGLHDDPYNDEGLTLETSAFESLYGG